MRETAQIESDVPRAELPAFELLPSPVPVPSSMNFTIADFERRGWRVRGRKTADEASKPDPVSVADLIAAGIETTADPEDFGAEPDWDKYDFRGQVGKLLWARGLRKKAIRFVSCNKCARPGVCSRYPEDHKFFVPNGCEVVFCKECANEVRRELFLIYRDVILDIVSNGIPHGYVLARVTFTLRSDGSEITPERVQHANDAVREVIKRSVFSAIREQTGLFCSLRADRSGGWKHKSNDVRGRKGLPDSWYGSLFTDESGFETRGHLPDSRRVAHGLNLHIHGLYFGPRLEWERTRDWWMEATRKRFGVESCGCYLTAICSRSDPGRLWADEGVLKWVRKNHPAASGAERDALILSRAVSWALNHMLKYVSKPPAVTPERLASLIAAFDGARRVHSLGLFYGKKPKREKRDCPCPKCKADGIVSVVGFEGRSLPNGGCVPRLELIERLLANGYVPLREAGRNVVLRMGVSREESWGASP
jgi:hypothetical protein